MRAVLSIGSNMADSRALLRSVVDDFADELVAASHVFSTPPWGGVEQEDFLNAVLIVEVDHSPLELLRRGQRLEQEAHRVREQRWGPRTLDVDIISLHDGTQHITSDTEELTVPHRHAHERAFVLVPWLDADPAAELAGESVAALVDKLDRDDVAGVREAGSL